MTEIEAAAITLLIKRAHGTDRIMSLRGAVNFDQGNPGETAGGFAATAESNGWARASWTPS